MYTNYAELLLVKQSVLDIVLFICDWPTTESSSWTEFRNYNVMTFHTYDNSSKDMIKVSIYKTYGTRLDE